MLWDDVNNIRNVHILCTKQATSVLWTNGGWLSTNRWLSFRLPRLVKRCKCVDGWNAIHRRHELMEWHISSAPVKTGKASFYISSVIITAPKIQVRWCSLYYLLLLCLLCDERSEIQKWCYTTNDKLEEKNVSNNIHFISCSKIQ